MKILFISHFLPYPAVDGASLRNFNLLKWLARSNETYLLTFTQRDRHATAEQTRAAVDALGEFCTSVEILPVHSDGSRLKYYSMHLRSLASGEPYSVTRFRSPEMNVAIKRAVQNFAPDVAHFDTLAVAQYRDGVGATPTVLNHHNIESILIRRRAEQEPDPAMAKYLRLQAARLLAYEKSCLSKFDVQVTVSEKDRSSLRELSAAARIETVPNGVDGEYFSPPDEPPTDNPNITFVGSMGWHPNRDGVCWFLKDVWPSLTRSVPKIEADFVGAHPPEELLRACDSDRRLRVAGFVDDVRPWLRRAGVFVVPLRVGGGTRLKILDAMASGLPVVSSEVGAEGLDFQNGSEIVVVDGAESFARNTAALLGDRERRLEMGRRARDAVVSRFSWNVVVPRLEDVYGSLL